MSQSVSVFIIPSTTISTTTPSSSSTGATIQFKDIGELFTCEATLVEWYYSGPEAPMSLNITNENVAQPAPWSNSSAAKSTTENGNITMNKSEYSGYGGTYLPQINEQIIATQLDPLMGIWRWPSTNVPQGWYQMLVTVQGVLDASSSSFFVQNGTAVDCVLQFYSASSIPTPTPTSAVTPATQVPATTASSPKAISRTRAVAGCITGGAVVFLILIIAIARRRERQDHMRQQCIDPSFSSNSPIVREGAFTPSLLHRQTDPVGMPIVPLYPSQPPAMPVPVGLSGKELARLRSTHTTAELTPASSSSSDFLATTYSPPIVVPTGQSEVTLPSEARITSLQSDLEHLQREVLRLHAQQVRAEAFEAPPSYGEGGHVD